MATETTFASSFSGRLPSVPGGTKIPGPGLKVKYGKFTIGTSECPDGGYTAADLATICGLSYIEAIVPCGGWTNGTHDNYFAANWDGAARKLQVFGNLGLDGMSLTKGTSAALNEIATDSAACDAAVLWALVIGY